MRRLGGGGSVLGYRRKATATKSGIRKLDLRSGPHIEAGIHDEDHLSPTFRCSD